MSARRFAVAVITFLLLSNRSPEAADPLQLAKLVPSLSGTSNFGATVVISGNTAVVGGARDAEGPAVYVFTNTAGQWSEQAVLRSPVGGSFGSALAISGDTIVAGVSSRRFGTNVSQGSVLVFARSAGVWNMQAELTASDGAAGDRFGQSVDISGDTIVVGAVTDDVGGNVDQGSAYAFTRSAGVWSLQAQLRANDGQTSDRFGQLIAISGDTVVVGATQDDVDGKTDQGSAYVFIRSAGAWNEQAQLTAGDGAAADLFASGIAISGDTVVVGANMDDVDGKTDQGSAYVFTRTAGLWSQQAQLTASDGAASDFFGSVAISGDTVVVGANGVDVAGKAFQGSAYVFLRSAGAWSQSSRLTAADGAAGDVFGGSVGINDADATIVVGASATLDNEKSGSVYIFAEPVVVARAGADQLLIGCAGCYVPVVLDGSASTDIHGAALQYAWREGGVVLATTTSPYSQAPVALGFGTHTIELTVTNGGGWSATDTVVVKIVAASSLAGPTGPQGSTGLQGPKGDKGDKGDPGEGLKPGSMLFIAAGSPAPTGYTFVGRFDLQLAETNRGRGTQVQFDVYRKN